MLYQMYMTLMNFQDGFDSKVKVTNNIIRKRIFWMAAY